MKTIIGNYADSGKYYTFQNIRYMCFVPQGDGTKPGFVTSRGHIIWLAEEEITPLPPECNSFDWVPPEPDPWARLKDEMSSALKVRNDFHPGSTCGEALHARGYVSGLRFALQEIQLVAPQLDIPPQ